MFTCWLTVALQTEAQVSGLTEQLNRLTIANATLQRQLDQKALVKDGFAYSQAHPVSDDHTAMIMFDALDPTGSRDVERDDLIQ